MPLLRASQFCRPSTPSHVEVSVCVLPGAANTDTIFPSAVLGPKRDPSTCAVVSEDILISLNVKNQSYAYLTHGRGDQRSAFQGGVVVRLCLAADNFIDRRRKIGISPTTAANLGIKSLNQTNLQNSCESLKLEALYEQVQLAGNAKLRPLGRSAKTVWPTCFIGDPDDKTGLDEGQKGTWPYPLSDSLIQRNKIISVYDSKIDAVYFYQVIQIGTSAVAGDEANNVLNDQDVAFVTGPDTIIEFDDTPLSTRSVPRLPALQCIQSFYKMIQSGEASESSPKPSSESSTILPPHPNLSQLQAAFGLSHISRPWERILHVIGSDSEHNLQDAVEAAANSLGMQCLSIKGLAAFAHSRGKVVRTGGLLDQLAGLEEAFDMIRGKRMEPCILHLYDFDEELSRVDEPLRSDQEARFWSKCVEALERYSNPFPSMMGEEHSKIDVDTSTVPLLILISTRQELKMGPFLQNFVFPPTRLETPDRDYTRYLCSNENESHLNDQMLQLLEGRSAREISNIHYQYRMEKLNNQATTSSEDNNEIACLRNICQEFDSERRRKDPTHAQVANVHWEDIGGIAHVRQEIMDTIELPLKHAHLFPKGSGRSGILLYGPPGTGKTLVAKAVATECGLPFLSVKGPELLGGYVGESEGNVREIFKAARKAAGRNTPIAASVLFFDELDSLAPRRGGLGDGGGVMERVVATLFSELDESDVASTEGETYGKVFVMGATNRPDLLDPNLLRRLDRLVYLGIPKDMNDRAAILAAQIRKLKLDREPLEAAKIVVNQLPPNLSGADLSTIGSGALLEAVERLCRLADAEVEESKGELSLDQVLESWDSEKRTPKVTVEDLVLAGKNVVPSVSQQELLRYESLREEFSNHKVSKK